VCHEYVEVETYFDLPTTLTQLGSNGVHIESVYGGTKLNK
jgi:hypothetical protein